MCVGSAFLRLRIANSFYGGICGASQLIIAYSVVDPRGYFWDFSATVPGNVSEQSL